MLLLTVSAACCSCCSCCSCCCAAGGYCCRTTSVLLVEPCKVLPLLQVFFFKHENPLFSRFFVSDSAHAKMLSIMPIFPTEILDTRKYYAQTLYWRRYNVPASSLPRLPCICSSTWVVPLGSFSTYFFPQYSLSGLVCFCPAWPVLVYQTCASGGASCPDHFVTFERHL